MALRTYTFYTYVHSFYRLTTVTYFMQKIMYSATLHRAHPSRFRRKINSKSLHINTKCVGLHLLFYGYTPGITVTTTPCTLKSRDKIIGVCALLSECGTSTATCSFN